MRSICTHPNCTLPVKGHGLCDKHYQAARALGAITPRVKRGIDACPHTDRKHQAMGMCASCYTKDWERRNPNNNSGNNWLKNNPEKAKQHLAKSHIQRTYGLTHDQHQALWNSQDGKCANRACGFKSEKLFSPMLERLDVDHDHKTGKIRGLLCRPCNQALSRVQDDMSVLKGLIAYLESH